MATAAEAKIAPLSQKLSLEKNNIDYYGRPLHTPKNMLCMTAVVHIYTTFTDSHFLQKAQLFMRGLCQKCLRNLSWNLFFPTSAARPRMLCCIVYATKTIIAQCSLWNEKCHWACIIAHLLLFFLCMSDVVKQGPKVSANYACCRCKTNCTHNLCS